MRLSTATRIWEPLRRGDEGVLDAAVRIQLSRPLSVRERQAFDVIWSEFAVALQKMSAAIAAALGNR